MCEKVVRLSRFRVCVSKDSLSRNALPLFKTKVLHGLWNSEYRELSLVGQLTERIEWHVECIRACHRTLHFCAKWKGMKFRIQQVHWNLLWLNLLWKNYSPVATLALTCAGSFDKPVAERSRRCGEIGRSGCKCLGATGTRGHNIGRRESRLC